MISLDIIYSRCSATDGAKASNGPVWLAICQCKKKVSLLHATFTTQFIHKSLILSGLYPPRRRSSRILSFRVAELGSRYEIAQLIWNSLGEPSIVRLGRSGGGLVFKRGWNG
jgi:hypothetical protein